MENKIIQPSDDKFYIPKVEFLADSGKCLIEGESFLEDAFKFYNGLIDWIKEYFKGANTLELNLKYNYFNTSSSKGILEMLKTLKDFENEGKAVTVYWHYPEPDHNDLLLEGEDFADDTDLDIQYVPYEEEE